MIPLPDLWDARHHVLTSTSCPRHADDDTSKGAIVAAIVVGGIGKVKSRGDMIGLGLDVAKDLWDAYNGRRMLSAGEAISDEYKLNFT